MLLEAYILNIYLIDSRHTYAKLILTWLVQTALICHNENKRSKMIHRNYSSTIWSKWRPFRVHTSKCNLRVPLRQCLKITAQNSAWGRPQLKRPEGFKIGVADLEFWFFLFYRISSPCPINMKCINYLCKFWQLFKFLFCFQEYCRISRHFSYSSDVYSLECSSLENQAGYPT